MAIETTKKKRVGVIATEATINSHLYRELIRQMDPEITVVGRPCPLFVPLVEEGWLHDSVTETVARRYLKDLQDQDIDTLILGCTHYPLLRSLIGGDYGSAGDSGESAYETSLALKRLLEAGGMMNPGTARSEFPYRFFVSDAAEKFKHFANSILPFDVNMTEQINIEEY